MPRQLPTVLLLFMAYREAEDRIFAALEEAGFGDITRAQGRLLAGIDEDGTRLVVLAERARVAKQTAQSLVDRLEQVGYVERVPDPDDGRARLIRLTAKGRKVVPAARVGEAEVEQEWTRLLGRRRLASLRGALEQLPGVEPS